VGQNVHYLCVHRPDCIFLSLVATFKSGLWLCIAGQPLTLSQLGLVPIYTPGSGKHRGSGKFCGTKYIPISHKIYNRTAPFHKHHIITSYITLQKKHWLFVFDGNNLFKMLLGDGWERCQTLNLPAINHQSFLIHSRTWSVEQHTTVSSLDRVAIQQIIPCLYTRSRSLSHLDHSGMHCFMVIWSII
jgi:hypothetical protein